MPTTTANRWKKCVGKDVTKDELNPFPNQYICPHSTLSSNLKADDLAA
jgi:hypothetical protein